MYNKQCHADGREEYMWDIPSWKPALAQYVDLWPERMKRKA